jgi:hypothetical protein
VLCILDVAKVTQQTSDDTKYGQDKWHENVDHSILSVRCQIHVIVLRDAYYVMAIMRQNLALCDAIR